ncbi:MAG TPA: carboxypeptidase regulatory-like domain-containing protein [Candidatus Acidoferrum sp.]|nr:carboxypeptidase regulatory-like domain-containing protein [Candidatus Acidoferrum sp.]
MKPALIALLGLLAASSSAAQVRNSSTDPAKSAVCSVSGLVVKLEGSAPLPSSTVYLQSVDDHTRTFSGVTDLGGRFEIKGVDPGRYHLRVIRNGYATQEYGQRTPNDPGAILALSPGQDLKDLLFRLVPSAVISGRIQNENGDPLPWVRVSALRATYTRGRRTLSSEVTVTTNDLGEYRLFGLRPGRYFISATYKPGQRLEPGEDDEYAADAGKSGYVPTYYPNSTDPAKGVAITIKTGDEISSTDILLEPTTVYSIRGRVNNSAARHNATPVILLLEARSSGLGWSVPARQTLVDKPDGAFEISDVLPGSYTLSAIWFDEGRRYQARQSIDIASTDADGLQLSLLPGMDIRGQINWDPRPALDGQPLTVSVRPVDSTFQYGAQARVPSSGTFLLRDLSEGLFRLSTAGQSQDCYLKGIRYAGMEVSDDEFNVIRGTQAILEVSISSRGARIQGTVADTDGLPAVGVTVVLVPNDAHRNEFHLYKQRTTDQYGRFDMRGIAPGDYKLFSWEQVEQNAWEEPDFLKQFEAKGQSVTLQEGDGKSIDLVAIRSASHE